VQIFRVISRTSDTLRQKSNNTKAAELMLRVLPSLLSGEQFFAKHQKIQKLLIGPKFNPTKYKNHVQSLYKKKSDYHRIFERKKLQPFCAKTAQIKYRFQENQNFRKSQSWEKSEKDPSIKKMFVSKKDQQTFKTLRER